MQRGVLQLEPSTSMGRPTSRQLTRDHSTRPAATKARWRFGPDSSTSTSGRRHDAAASNGSPPPARMNRLPSGSAPKRASRRGRLVGARHGGVRRQPFDACTGWRLRRCRGTAARCSRAQNRPNDSNSTARGLRGQRSKNWWRRCSTFAHVTSAILTANDTARSAGSGPRPAGRFSFLPFRPRSSTRPWSDGSCSLSGPALIRTAPRHGREHHAAQQHQ